MIQTETFYIGEREFTRTYSDAGKYVVRDGVEYSEACDPSEFNRTYTEGNYMTPNEQQMIQESHAEEILNIILGGAE